jgi:hypothetical protein
MESLPSPRTGQGPVYVYNGMANLRELKEVSLDGASLYFNGSFRLEDLRDVELGGANIYLNGQYQVRNTLTHLFSLLKIR